MTRAPRDPIAAFDRLDTRGKRLVLFVAHYRRRRGTGPTWREAASAVGVDDPAARWPLMAAVAPCVTWKHMTPRSLDVAAELAPVLEPVLERATRGKEERSA